MFVRSPAGTVLRLFRPTSRSSLCRQVESPPHIDLIYSSRCGILIALTPYGVDTAESSVRATGFVDTLTTEKPLADRGFGLSQIYELLEQVQDRDSFLAFVHALADERERAAILERQEPIRFSLGGAFDWQNGDIESYLRAASDYFTERPLSSPETEPSWRMFADFLWCGKIIE